MDKEKFVTCDSIQSHASVFGCSRNPIQPESNTEFESYLHKRKGKDLYLAENLQYLRTLKRMSQEDLAEYLNTTGGAVSMWERKKRVPDIETIVKIARFFEVSLDDLILKKLWPQTSVLVRNIKFLQKRYGISNRDIALISAASSKTAKGILKSLIECQESVERIADYFGVPIEDIYLTDLSKEIGASEVSEFIGKKFPGLSGEEMGQITEKYLSERS